MCWFNANDYDDDCGDDDICRYTRCAQQLHNKTRHTTACTVRTHWHSGSGYRFVLSLIWAHSHNGQPSLIIDRNRIDQNGRMIRLANRLAEFGSFGNCYCGQQLAKSVLFLPFQVIYEINERKNEKCAAVVVTATLELERNWMKQVSIEKKNFNSKSVCTSTIATFQAFQSFGFVMCTPRAFSLPIVIVIIIVIIYAHTHARSYESFGYSFSVLRFLLHFCAFAVPTFCISIIINCLSNY